MDVKNQNKKNKRVTFLRLKCFVILELLLYVQDIQDEADRPFYDSDKDDGDNSDDSAEGKPKPKPFIMDSDHRLLLRQAKPLLNSRNASVSIQ